MAVRTHLPSKDAALEDTIERATALLKRHGFSIDLVSWMNPVENCWSVHLRSNDCPHLYTNGKGGTKLASQASALLEFFERVSTNLFFADYYLGDDAASSGFVFYPDERWFSVEDPATVPTHASDGAELLNEELREFYDPAGELTPALLRDNNSDEQSRGIAALPFENMRREETVYFPVSVLNNIYASNGMAAGNTPTECRAQALAEVLERYVKNRVIAQGTCLPDVPEEVIDRYPRIQKGIAELREHGFSILVKDGSLGGRFPVICVILINPENGGCYASFGASCLFEVALERTVTELLQGRQLDQLDVFQPPSHDLEAVADTFNLESHFIDSGGLLSWRMFRDEPDFDFCDWDWSGSSAEECDRLKQMIFDQGFDAYCASYQSCGIYTCRIIVPGMSEIYPVDDLLWNNKSTGATLRPELLKLGRMTPDELKELLEYLHELELNDLQPISDAIGVLFDDDSSWKPVRVGELKAMLALAVGDLEQAAQWCQWCHNVGYLPPERQKLYRATLDLIEFELSEENPENYLAALESFYGRSLIQRSRRTILGESKFDGLDFADSWEELSPAHGRLLTLYRTLHRLKSSEVDPLSLLRPPTDLAGC